MTIHTGGSQARKDSRQCKVTNGNHDEVLQHRCKPGVFLSFPCLQNFSNLTLLHLASTHRAGKCLVPGSLLVLHKWSEAVPAELVGAG